MPKSARSTILLQLEKIRAQAPHPTTRSPRRPRRVGLLVRRAEGFPMPAQTRTCIAATLTALILLTVTSGRVLAQTATDPVVGQALGPFEFTGSVRSLPKADLKAQGKYQHPIHGPLLPGQTPGGPQGGPIDPLVQIGGSQSPSPNLGSPAPFIPAPIVGFDGIPGGNPPDTNGVVGPNHYVQTINVSFEIWDKTGTSLAGPTDIRTLFS